MKRSLPPIKTTNPVKLVWFIIILGCCVGFILSSIVWWLSVDLRHKRQQLEALSDSLVAGRNNIEQEATRIRWQYASLFREDGKDHDINGDNLTAMVHSYEALANFNQAELFFVDLKKDLQVLQQQEYLAKVWARKQNAHGEKMVVVNGQISKALALLSESLMQAHGRKRLQLVLRYQKMQTTLGAMDPAMAQKLAADGVRGSGFFALKQEVADLNLLVEQLRGEARIDHLVDLKDNRLRTTLLRLQREVARLDLSEQEFKGEFTLLLRGVTEALFGGDYVFKNQHQTIKVGQGGFYLLIEEQLQLGNELEELRTTVSSAFGQIQTQLRETATQVNRAMQTKADLREISLKRAWQLMLFISVVTAIIFLLVSARILKAIRFQIRAIQNANKKLSSQTSDLLENEEVLRDNQVQLEYLSSSLLTAQEDERQRVAYELHDELGQSMTALKLQVRSLVRSLGEPMAPIIQRKCQGLSQSIKDIIESVRQLSKDLSPAILEDLGVDEALINLLTTFEELHQISVSYDIHHVHIITNLNTQRNVYRIVQELLTNISKHARADEIRLQVKKEVNQLIISMTDNGQGFDVEQMKKSKNAQKGMGLSTIKERVRIMGGELDIQSETGAGVEVVFSVPVG